ncbi:NAD(P)H: quinone oxidoreduvtase, type IV, flavoprotein WrbA [Gracilibacillus halophilus YIM-C55.5]|uniref:NAD(P)H: quinone oxidoreduvtase, type IV, flavoprotein WrbA n=1 Tax=Gracilibacillus halophilus YIM-C55.5 TaxID=1308866 RepID=N4WD84_9BACI|nr:NAD(P)H:quinone oxidoreductase [Gracilibacillus halophilus]ENH97234.1 NAD(P)H: quinone oxidoreduvtase, type IV, flavoprotein WrbA [Gracilibacillus halophilus YIM-C55.5]
MANVAVIYYSSTGTNYQMANWAAGAAKNAGAEAKVVRVRETAPEAAINSNEAWKNHLEETKDVPVATSDDIEWADAIIFAMPTRFGNLPAQMKQFLDEQGGLWATGKTVNKVVSGITSASNAHGGQEATVQALYTSMMHWGTIIVSPGYTDDSIFAAGGNPYGTSVTQSQEDGSMVEDVEAAVRHQAHRVVEITNKIHG